MLITGVNLFCVRKDWLAKAAPALGLQVDSAGISARIASIAGRRRQLL